MDPRPSPPSAIAPAVTDRLGRLHWPVIFDRGRVQVPRGFPTRQEAVVYATLFLSADRVVIVEAATAAEAEATARRS